MSAFLVVARSCWPQKEWDWMALHPLGCDIHMQFAFETFKDLPNRIQHCWKGFYNGMCVLKWEGTDSRLAGSTSCPEPIGRSWASQGVLVSVMPVLHRGRDGPGEGAGFPWGTLEKAEVMLFWWIWRTVPDKLPCAQTWLRICEGSWTWTFLLLETRVFTVTFIVLYSWVSGTLCTELRGQTQSFGIDENVNFLLHADHSNGGRP